MSEAFIEPLDLQHDADFDDLKVSARFLYRMSLHHHLSGGIARGFRAPGLDDMTIFGQFNAGVEVPNPDLEPESLLNYELSFKALYPTVWRSVPAFDSRRSDFIVRAPGSFLGSPTFQGEDVFQRQNLDRAEIYGAELDFRAWLMNRLIISLSLAKTRGSNDQTGEPLRRIPPKGAVTGSRP